MHGTGGDMNILVVEDRKDDRYMLETMLHGCGFSTLGAANGHDALLLLKQQPVDLILSDVLMPVMDGYELLHACKADKALRDIPFVFYTANYTHEKDEHFALNLGAAAFLYKPVPLPELLHTIETVMEQSCGGGKAAQSDLLDEQMFQQQHQQRLEQTLEEKVADLERANLQLQDDMLDRQRSESRFRSVVDASFDAMLVYQQGAVVFANPAARTLAGVTADEDIIGQTLIDRLDGLDNSKAWQPELNEHLDGVAVRFRRLDERYIDVEVNSSPFEFNNHPAVLIGRPLARGKRGPVG